jgi:hypothetical protein
MQNNTNKPITECAECGERLEATLLVYTDIAAIQPDGSIRMDDIEHGFHPDWKTSLVDLDEADVFEVDGVEKKAWSVSCKNGHDHSHLVTRIQDAWS